MKDTHICNYREFAKLLKRNGYVLDRQTGSHCIWESKDGKDKITINFTNPNRLVMQRLIKEHNLV